MGEGSKGAGDDEGDDGVGVGEVGALGDDLGHPPVEGVFGAAVGAADELPVGVGAYAAAAGASLVEVEDFDGAVADGQPVASYGDGDGTDVSGCGLDLVGGLGGC